MHRIGPLKGVVLMLSCWGMTFSAPIVQAAPAGKTTERPIISADLAGIDVELGDGGVLQGQALDSSGRPLVGLPISIRCRNRELAAAVTDAAGRFRAAQLRGGTYEIAAGPARSTCRLWAPHTAPPSARHTLLIVAGSGPVRGQQGMVGRWLGNPWIIGATVAAAVAVPIVIHNQRIDRVASP